MPSPPRTSLIFMLRGWIAVVLVLIALAIVFADRGLGAVFGAPAILLGLPIVVLLFLELGRVLRAQAFGGFAATRTTQRLGWLQAGWGALCLGLGGFVVYQVVTHWKAPMPPLDAARLVIGMYIGVRLLMAGFGTIWTALVPGKNDSEEGGNDA